MQLQSKWNRWLIAAYMFVKNFKRRKAIKEAWMRHGCTVEFVDGGVWHFASYKEAATSLSLLYNTVISSDTVRNCVRYNKPLKVKVVVATISKRKEIKK